MGTGRREPEGYLLNREDLACVFLDQGKNLCTIHETRPLVCRPFACGSERREQLVELGIRAQEFKTPS
jgi:Fe-S-cluster containining protein